MLQTLQNLALARLWSLGSARIRRSKTSHLPDCGLWALRDCGRSCAGCGLGALARRSSLWILDASDAPKPRTCQTVGSGLCEPVGGVAQIVGSGLWRAKYFFLVARNCPSHVSNLSNPSIPSNPSTNCQWFCHTSGFWTLQTLQNLALARLWALGSVRDCG